MHNSHWILIDTETNGFTYPIIVVEIGAQKMQGWQPVGSPFRRLINQNVDIPPGASRVNGYTREILERDGEKAEDVYRDFAAYVNGLPIVAFNMQYDYEKVLKPEWKRLGIPQIGTAGFCALRLAQRLLDPVPAGNCKLQTLRQYYRLPERGAHTALGDVETVADLLANVLQPIAEQRELKTWKDICDYTESDWFPSRIAFGKFKGRHFLEARKDQALYDWLQWLESSSNANSAKMGRWYLEKIDSKNSSVNEGIIIGSSECNGDTSNTSGFSGVVIYTHPEIEQLRQMIASTRARLADLEASYTQERHAIDVTKSTLFGLLRVHYQKRDRIYLIVEYRSKYLDTLIREGEEDAEEVVAEFEQAKTQSENDYDQADAAASSQKELTVDEEVELKSLWKKLVRLYHPDRFANQPDLVETYQKLTSTINQARDSGDIELLRDIANHPHRFILRQGWSSLNFDDEAEVMDLRRLFETLQINIVNTMELLSDLYESPDFELHQHVLKSPEFLQEVAEERAKMIEVEINQLNEKAATLADEIAELSSVVSQQIA